MNTEKSLWRQFKESNFATRLGAYVMAAGLSSVALGIMASGVTVQWNNHPSAEVEHDIDYGLLIGGCVALLIGQQVLIRGHRQEIAEGQDSTETN